MRVGSHQELDSVVLWSPKIILVLSNHEANNMPFQPEDAPPTHILALPQEMVDCIELLEEGIPQSLPYIRGHHQAAPTFAFCHAGPGTR